MKRLLYRPLSGNPKWYSVNADVAGDTATVKKTEVITQPVAGDRVSCRKDAWTVTAVSEEDLEFNLTLKQES